MSESTRDGIAEDEMLWAKSEIDMVLMNANKSPSKNWARGFLKALVAKFDTEDSSLAMQGLFMDENPAGIEYGRRATASRIKEDTL